MTAQQKSRLPRLFMQLVGMILGIGLLAWCIQSALTGGDFSRIRNADPWLVVGLLGASLVNQLVSIAIFFLSIRPVRKLRFADLTWVNLASSMLNYAPFRIGLLARVAWHARVDRMPLLTIGAWFGSIGGTTVGAVGAAAVATLIRPQFDWIWWIILVAGLGLAGLCLRFFASTALLRRFGQGADLMLGDPLALWGSMVLRLIDLAAGALRLWLAVRILGLDFTFDQVVLMAMAALIIGMNPLGRLGFREAAVAFLAARFSLGDAGTIESTQTQLALVESAGEAMLVIPLGLLAVAMLSRRWREASRPTTATNPQTTTR